MLISKEPIKVADLEKLANRLANAEWCTGDRSFSESKKNFGRLLKQETFKTKQRYLRAVKNTRFH